MVPTVNNSNETVVRQNYFYWAKVADLPVMISPKVLLILPDFAFHIQLHQQRNVRHFLCLYIYGIQMLLGEEVHYQLSNQNYIQRSSVETLLHARILRYFLVAAGCISHYGYSNPFSKRLLLMNWIKKRASHDVMSCFESSKNWICCCD